MQNGITDSQLNSKVFYIAIVAITLIATALRFFRLDDWGFWIDELYSVRQAGQFVEFELGARVLGAASAALSLWLEGIDLALLSIGDYTGYKAAGVNEMIARVPVTITGSISILLLGLVAARFMGRYAALIAVSLLALSTWHIWMSQVSRFYAQQFLFFNLSLLCYYLATEATIDKKRLYYWITTSVFFVIAFTSQLTSLLLVGIFVTDWVVSRLVKQKARWGMAGWVSISVAVTTCAALVIRSFGENSEHYTNFKSGSQSVLDLLLGVPYLINIVLVALAILSIFALYNREPRKILFLATAAFLPFFAFSFFKIMGKDVHVRYLFMCLFPWLSLAAMGLVNLTEKLWLQSRQWSLALIPCAVVLASMVLADFDYFAGGFGFRHRYKEAFEYIKTHRNPGEGFVADWNTDTIGEFYLEEKAKFTLTAVEDLDRLREPTWIVVNAVSGLHGYRFRALDEFTDFKAYFNSHVPQPYSSVHVYYYDPSR